MCSLDGNPSIVFQQADSYDRVDQMSLLRQEQLLKSQSLQSDALDGSSRYSILVRIFVCCIKSRLVCFSTEIWKFVII